MRAETDEKDAGERVAALARRVNQKRRFFLAFELALGGDAFAECAQALAEGRRAGRARLVREDADGERFLCGDV